jgi:DNA polymerase-3 subunit alpha
MSIHELEYSLLDGLNKCEDIAKRTESIGANACVLSDHGNVSGAVDFMKEMQDKNLKPILGCELYISVGPANNKSNNNKKLSHQVVLAKNLDGWRDLLNIVSTSNKKENFYYKPRVDLEILKAYASKGNLVTFSGHLGSTLANYITLPDNKLDPNWMNLGMAYAQKLQSIFGKENFFIEIQLIDSRINKFAAVIAGALREIATKLNIPCVATPDAHYCTRENAIDQRVLLCTSFKKTLGEVNQQLKRGTASNILKTFFASDNYHIPSYEDMIEFHTEEELANTNLVADMCENYNILNPPQPPEFHCPDNMSPEDYLRKLCRDGWKSHMKHISKDRYKEYGDRVNMELEVFTSVGLSSYFLIIHDILNYVRSRGYITGPGRGSSAGCIVSRLLDIVKVDPIKYHLLFERFYNAGRNEPGKVSWPDIDFDIPKCAREETVEYIRNKYGHDNVAQIITFQTLKGKAALKRVMQADGKLDFAEQNAITHCLLDQSKVEDELPDIEEEYGFSSSILWALENTPEKLEDWCTIGKDNNLEGPLKDIFNQAIRLEHTKIISGKHAAGIVISDQPISSICPMILDKDGEHMLAGFEGPKCEDVGLLKLDCLAIRRLDKMQDMVKIIAGEDDTE